MHKSNQELTAGVAPPLNIVLTTDGEAFKVGDSVPVKVEVRNVSGKPLRVVGVLDGSEAGVRYPHYTARVTGPDYQPPTLERPEYTSPLRPQDFRLLKSSEGFDPTVPLGGAAYVPLVCFSHFCPPSPGRYKLSLTLSTDSDSDEEWLGTLPFAQDEALPLIAQVPHVRVESNVLVIHVR